MYELNFIKDKKKYAAILGVLLVVSVFFQKIGFPFQLSYIFLSIFFCIILLKITERMEHNSRLIVWIVLSAYFIRVIAGVLFDVNLLIPSDSVAYLQGGIENITMWENGIIGVSSIVGYHFGYPLVNGIFFLLFGINATMFNTFNAFFAVLTGLRCADFVSKEFVKKPLPLVVLFIALYPSGLLFSLLNLKETIVVYLVTEFLIACYNYCNNEVKLYRLMMLSALTMTMRYQFGALFFILLGIIYFGKQITDQNHRKDKIINMRLLKSVIVMVLIFVLGFGTLETIKFICTNTVVANKSIFFDESINVLDSEIEELEYLLSKSQSGEFDSYYPDDNDREQMKKNELLSEEEIQNKITTLKSQRDSLEVIDYEEVDIKSLISESASISALKYYSDLSKVIDNGKSSGYENTILTDIDTTSPLGIMKQILYGSYYFMFAPTFNMENTSNLVLLAKVETFFWTIYVLLFFIPSLWRLIVAKNRAIYAIVICLLAIGLSCAINAYNVGLIYRMRLQIIPIVIGIGYLHFDSILMKLKSKGLK